MAWKFNPFTGTLDDVGTAGSGITSLTGDVTATGPGAAAATVANDAITNAKLANMATQTIKGRTTGGTGDPEDLSATQATAILNSFVGDSGSGGTKGLVPAPASGDARKILKGSGSFVDWDGQYTLTLATDGVSWDDLEWPFAQGLKDYGITIVRVEATVMGTSSPALLFNIEERTFGSLSSAGTDVFASDQSADADGLASTTFSNAVIDATDHLVLTTGTSAETGTVSLITVTVYWRRN